MWFTLFQTLFLSICFFTSSVNKFVWATLMLISAIYFRLVSSLSSWFKFVFFSNRQRVWDIASLFRSSKWSPKMLIQALSSHLNLLTRQRKSEVNQLIHPRKLPKSWNRTCKSPEGGIVEQEDQLHWSKNGSWVSKLSIWKRHFVAPGSVMKTLRPYFLILQERQKLTGLLKSWFRRHKRSSSFWRVSLKFFGLWMWKPTLNLQSPTAKQSPELLVTECSISLVGSILIWAKFRKIWILFDFCHFSRCERSPQDSFVSICYGFDDLDVCLFFNNSLWISMFSIFLLM